MNVTFKEKPTAQNLDYYGMVYHKLYKVVDATFSDYLKGCLVFLPNCSNVSFPDDEEVMILYSPHKNRKPFDRVKIIPERTFLREIDVKIEITELLF